MADNEKFELVGRRRRGKRASNVLRDNSRSRNTSESEFDVDNLSRKLKEAKDELNDSKYKVSLFQSLKQCTQLLDVDRINEIVCYGLGNFSNLKQSRYQLALLLILRDSFSAQALIYDPLFLANEVRYLESIDCQVLRENEEGKRKVESTTLVYLPHCPKQLTNNYLYANWGPGIKNSILLTNSFTEILDSHTTKAVVNTAGYIARINPFVEEIQLENSFLYKNVFNDSALHIFTKDNLDKVPIGFWADREEPVYERNDIEFIANVLKPSLTP